MIVQLGQYSDMMSESDRLSQSDRQFTSMDSIANELLLVW